MRLKTKIKNAVRRNERRMTTKKSKKAFGTIALAIAFMLSINAFIAWANSSETVTFENNWDARIEAESPTVTPEAQDEAKDGVLEGTEEGVAVQSSSSSEVVRMIEEKFPDNKELIAAVFKAESGHNPRSMGWNCYYNTVTGEVLNANEALKLPRNERKSTSCKEAHRHMAWSVDCGVAQINKIGKTCPEELFEVEHNLAVAKKMYDARGLNPWMAYLNGSYKKHL